MQDRDNDDAIVSELIEKRIWKTAKKNAPKCAMYKPKSQWISSDQGDCIVDRFDEILAELR